MFISRNTLTERQTENNGAPEPVEVMEAWVGRMRSNSAEIPHKPITAHIVRMTGGNAFNQKKKYQIVRQSMPYGTHTGEAGLFFLAYADSPENFNLKLDRMVGTGGDGHCDDIMRFSCCTKGTYWYFPGVQELKKLE